MSYSAIHRLWIGPPNPNNVDADTIASVMEAPRLWSAEELADLYPDHTLHFIDHPRHAANMARWLLMRDYGGLWLDMDMAPISDLRKPYAYIPASPDDMIYSCALNFPEPEHPFARLMVKQIEHRSRAAGPTHLRSGDGLLAYTYRKLWLHDGLGINDPVALERKEWGPMMPHRTI